MTHFILVRHGQTEWNRVERFRGQSDVPLNETGLTQAAATARRIAAEWQPAAIYHSPLGRARQTAEAIAAPFGLTPRPHPGLLDIHFGHLQGLTAAEARARWPAIVESWLTTPDKTLPPGGERLADVSGRAMAAVHEIAAWHPDQTVALVGHQVLNRVILLGVLGLSLDRLWRIGQNMCALNVFDLEGGEFTLLSLNDTCHLR
jgi:broad specificity phosphatase PhoE